MLPLIDRPDGSVRLTVDRRLFSRALVVRAAATVVDRCHVLIDLDEEGRVTVAFTPRRGQGGQVLRPAAGHFCNILVSMLAAGNLATHDRTARNLLLARALDGALPGGVAGESSSAAQEPEP